MDFKQVKIGLKVRISPGYTTESYRNLVCVVCSETFDSVPIHNETLPYVCVNDWGIPSEWDGMKFCRFPARHFTPLEDQRVCIQCLDARSRLDINGKDSLDGKCWSCYETK